MADPDQLAVYAAEADFRALLDSAEKYENWDYEFYGYKMQLPRERKFADLESIQRYLDMVMELPQVKARWSRETPKVRPRSNGAFAHYEPATNQIAICVMRGERGAMRELLVLHELAHALERDKHGPRWRGALIFLVQECVGHEAAMVLGAFLDQEVGASHVMM
jgi:putative metallohydrolase (TIGR04338 family)